MHQKQETENNMQYFNNTITKDEAIMIMKHGGKVTHEYFSPGEWVTMKNNFTVVTEEGYEISETEFWQYRSNPNFEKGWSILEFPIVTPKEEAEHLKLTKNRRYTVGAIFNGDFHILNDHGVYDFYSPSLFKRG